MPFEHTLTDRVKLVEHLLLHDREQLADCLFFGPAEHLLRGRVPQGHHSGPVVRDDRDG
jgi:hypothetical protein